MCPTFTNRPSAHVGHLACVIGLVGAAVTMALTPAFGGEAREVRKILFLGNSITKHGPAPAIGWTGNWGMAASAQEKDFVHLVTSSLARTMKAAPEVRIANIATFERQYATYDIDSKLKSSFDFGADLVILAIWRERAGPKVRRAENSVLPTV